MENIDLIMLGILSLVAFVVIIGVMNADVNKSRDAVKVLWNDIALLETRLGELKVEHNETLSELEECTSMYLRAKEYGDILDSRYKWHEMSEKPDLGETVLVIREVLGGERIVGLGYSDGKDWRVKKPALLKGRWTYLPDYDIVDDESDK